MLNVVYKRQEGCSVNKSPSAIENVTNSNLRRKYTGKSLRYYHTVVKYPVSSLAILNDIKNIKKQEIHI